VDSNHRPPGPEPDVSISWKSLKLPDLQLLHFLQLLLLLVEARCACWSLEAFTDTKSSTSSERASLSEAKDIGLPIRSFQQNQATPNHDELWGMALGVSKFTRLSRNMTSIPKR